MSGADPSSADIHEVTSNTESERSNAAAKTEVAKVSRVEQDIFPPRSAGDPDEGRQRRYGELQQAIAGIVKGLPKGMHLTAPEVYEKARAQGLDISLSTVYRTLHKLRRHGDVNTIAGERGIRYEMAEEGEDHDHLICLGCGLTIEFSDELIRGFGKNVAQRKGFEHRASRFDILGYCQSCTANDHLRRVDQSNGILTAAMEEIESASTHLRQCIENNQSRKPARISNLEATIENLRQALADCADALSLMT